MILITLFLIGIACGVVGTLLVGLLAPNMAPPVRGLLGMAVGLGMYFALVLSLGLA